MTLRTPTPGLRGRPLVHHGALALRLAAVLASAGAPVHARGACANVLDLEARDRAALMKEQMKQRRLPGVTSRNSVVLLRQGRGNDGDAAFSKFGPNFSLRFSRSEGQAQAVRALVEPAAIELMGKLTRTPYWSCLGAQSSQSDEIRREVSDWFFQMARSRLEFIGWFQQQLRLRLRGFYEGPVDGRFNPAIDEAISAYRAALGLERVARLDERFFAAFLAAGQPLDLPGSFPFRMTMKRPDGHETLACFAAPADILSKLPAAMVGTDFEPLAGVSVAAIRSAGRAAARAAAADASAEVSVR